MFRTQGGQFSRDRLEVGIGFMPGKVYHYEPILLILMNSNTTNLIQSIKWIHNGSASLPCSLGRGSCVKPRLTTYLALKDQPKRSWFWNITQCTSIVKKLSSALSSLLSQVVETLNVVENWSFWITTLHTLVCVKTCCNSSYLNTESPQGQKI